MYCMERKEGEKDGPKASSQRTGRVHSPSLEMRRAVDTKRLLGKEDELTLAILILRGQCPVTLQAVGQVILECGREVWLEFALKASGRLSGLA